MKTTLIITGGNIKSEFLKKHLEINKYNTIIAVDKGLEALDKLEIEPNYIIGDFDSISEIILKKYEKNIITLNKEKDYTDTHMALKLAIEIKSDKVVILGATGTRIDHTIANIHILKEALANNLQCTIMDENNKIFLIDKSTEIKQDKNYKYLSIIPLTTEATGITLKGFKYLLNNGKLTVGESIGVSNEQIEPKATIEVKNGILIIIYSKD